MNFYFTGKNTCPSNDIIGKYSWPWQKNDQNAQNKITIKIKAKKIKNALTKWIFKKVTDEL